MTYFPPFHRDCHVKEDGSGHEDTDQKGSQLTSGIWQIGADFTGEQNFDPKNDVGCQSQQVGYSLQNIV
jgi:hypothetical protein